MEKYSALHLCDNRRANGGVKERERERERWKNEEQKKRENDNPVCAASGPRGEWTT